MRRALLLSRSKYVLVASACGVAVAAGGISYVLGHVEPGRMIWATTIGLASAILAASILIDIVRGKAGVDVIALLAMAGALTLREYFAGAVICLMYVSGRALEEHAHRRARRELSALLERAPSVAHRYENDTIHEIPVAEARRGDRLLVRAGESVPVDGTVVSAVAVIDESALTGESLPAHKQRGDRVASGSLNAGDAFDVEALAAADESTYAGVVRLVEAAQASRAPLVRVADRYALLFVAVTLVLAAAAWALSGDPARALAVLVVATPCPLLIAVPVAIVAGMSQAARRGILLKDGAALEALGRARVAVLDKTGTITGGRARLAAVETCGAIEGGELLRLAASLDQGSQHVLARSLVEAARERNLDLRVPCDVREQPGSGVTGVVDGHEVAVGSFAWITRGSTPSEWMRRVLRRLERDGAAGVFVAVDGAPAGALLLADRLRPETPRALRKLRRAGVERIVLLSGDRQEVAETVALALGFDTVLAERSPAAKVDAVLAERRHGVTMMVGDGVNDAPALAASDIGVAMGARGSAVSCEAAAAVLLVDRLDRLGEALVIAQRSRRIALQSVFAGVGLSLVAMVAASLGLLVPVAGAVVQELIDVAVILNALRARRSTGAEELATSVPHATVLRLQADHEALRPILERIGELADGVDQLDAGEARAALGQLDTLLQERLLPHERADETEVYPYFEQVIGGDDPLAAMSRTHREIHKLARLLHGSVEDLDSGAPLDADRAHELRRTLYGLSAVLQLHFGQEEELYATRGRVESEGSP